MNETRSLLSEDDLYLFNEGSHLKLYEKLGAHVMDGGVHFAVWAPDAQSVSVIGDFNGWAKGANPLQPRGVSGIWEGFIEGLMIADAYKYHIESRHMGYQVEKADPFAFHAETPPKTASKVWQLDYDWSDAEWMAHRAERQTLEQPVSIYDTRSFTKAVSYGGCIAASPC